jgi:hypothetical protein
MDVLVMCLLTVLGNPLSGIPPPAETPRAPSAALKAEEPELPLPRSNSLRGKKDREHSYRVQRVQQRSSPRQRSFSRRAIDAT